MNSGFFPQLQPMAPQAAASPWGAFTPANYAYTPPAAAAPAGAFALPSNYSFDTQSTNLFGKPNVMTTGMPDWLNQPAAKPSLLSWFGDGKNLEGAAKGLGALTQAWGAYQGNKMAKANLAFQKDAFNTNMNNSIRSYNTGLEDRIRGRTSSYDGKENDVQAYLSKHSLSRDNRSRP
jgi:hypothetical protein